MKKNYLDRFDKDLVKKNTKGKMIDLRGVYVDQFTRDLAKEADRRAIEEGDFSMWII